MPTAMMFPSKPCSGAKATEEADALVASWDATEDELIAEIEAIRCAERAKSSQSG